MKTTTVKGIYHGNDVDFNGEPVLVDGRLKVHGTLSAPGWDIPTIWALDHANKLWMDDAHGSALNQVEPKLFYSECRICGDEQALSTVRKALSLKPAAPLWMSIARASGWTPPNGFVIDDFEWNE